ncbi:MAG TPA: hypothetical protein VJZ04_08550 [Lachnospiraceae bacterium]|nr:hypothetical protein [Lachnospiraceae bacterium]
MDNFMDKLAQKITAGEIIRANSDAEEKELKRLQLQIAEYDDRLQEIRKLNLKNLELADKAEELVEISMEKVKDINEASEVITALEIITNTLGDNRKNVEELFRQGDEAMHKECVKVYRNVQAAVTDELKIQTEILEKQNSKTINKMKGIKILLIIGLLLVAADLGIQIAHILGVF